MSEGEKKVLLGNEAIARGIVESGCQFFAAYPGTPSSEILPAVVRFKKENNLDIYVEWSTNEKVAFENALVASYTGKRAAVAMKQVGLECRYRSSDECRLYRNHRRLCHHQL